MAEIDDLSVTDASNTGRFPEGQAPSTVNDGARALEGMIARWDKDTLDSNLRATLSSSVYEITTNRSISAYDGLCIFFRANAANSVGDVDLRINGNSAHDFQLPGGVEIPAGYIAADQWVWAQFKGTASTWQMMSPIVIDDFILTLLNDASASAVRTTIDAQEDVITTRGDIIVGNSSGAADRLATGTAKQVVTTDGTDTTFETLDFSYISGTASATQIQISTKLTVGSATGTTNDGDVNAEDLKINGDPIALHGETVQTASGTAVDFTGLPAGVSRIILVLDGVSLSSSGDLLVQIGDSGGVETSGYDSTGANTSGGASTSTAGFIARLSSSSLSFWGHFELTNISSNTWVCSHHGAQDNQGMAGGGAKSLSGTLDRVRVTRDGSDTFDSGNIKLFWQIAI